MPGAEAPGDADRDADADADADQLIAGRFEVGDLLGTGSSSAVYRAVDRDGTRVALKVLHPHLAVSAAAREAFLAEARIADGLAADTVARVIGWGAAGAPQPLAWMATEFVEGTTLAERVDREGALPVAVALDVADDVLAALEAVHERGVAHRDLAPGNVIVREQEGRTRARLVDFGLAGPLGTAATEHGPLAAAAPAAGAPRIVGSVHFLSPEQARGQAVGVSGDLYGVGALLYVMLTGEPPFARRDAADVLQAHVSAPPPAPSGRRRGVPRALDRLVVRALAKRPEGRFADAAEMRRELAAVRADRVGDARTRILAPAGAAGPGGVAGGATGPGGAERRAPWQPGDPRPWETAPAGAARAVAPASARRRAAGAWTLVGVVGVFGLAGVVAAFATTGADVPAGPDTVATAGPAPEPSAPVATPAAPDGTVPSGVPSALEARAVPPVEGLTLAEASAAIQRAGLVVWGSRLADSVRAEGAVLRTEPEAGTSLAAGAEVVLIVASGSNAVPGVAGMATGDAIAAVQNAGFEPVLLTRADLYAPAGTVLGSQPGETTVLRLGTRVTVLVAAEAPAPSSTPTPPAPTPTP